MDDSHTRPQCVLFVASTAPPAGEHLTRVAAVVLIALACLACAAPLDGNDRPVSSPDSAGVRAWRIIYFAWDDNELQSAFAADVAELASAGLSEDLFHCIAVRDSVLTGGEIELIRRGGATLVPIDLQPDATLFDRSTIAAVRRSIERSFPAEREIVVIAAHGRGWRGIGSRMAEPDRVLPGRDVPALLGCEENEPSDQVPRLAVFDIGYGANAETFAGLDGAVDRVVAAGGPRHDAGVDFQRLGRSLEGAAAPSMETVYAAFVDEFHRTVPDHTVACTDEELAEIPDTVERFATAASAAVSTRDRQNSVQNDLLAAALVPDLPGDAFISASAVTAALDNPTLSVPENLLFHLVRLDEIGTPTGHDTEYRPYPAGTALTDAFAALPWAPDTVARRGVLFDVWYRQF